MDVYRSRLKNAISKEQRQEAVIVNGKTLNLPRSDNTFSLCCNLCNKVVSITSNSENNSIIRLYSCKVCPSSFDAPNEELLKPSCSSVSSNAESTDVPKINYINCGICNKIMEFSDQVQNNSTSHTCTECISSQSKSDMDVSLNKYARNYNTENLSDEENEKSNTSNTDGDLTDTELWDDDKQLSPKLQDSQITQEEKSNTKRLHTSKVTAEEKSNIRMFCTKLKTNDESELRAKSERYQFIVKCMIIINGKRSYKCPTCSKDFKRSSDFMIHQSVHTGEKPHVCDLCGKAFRIANSLKSHKLHFHLREKKYSCHICSRMFVAKQALNLHIDTHKDKDCKPFICELCGKKFRQYNSMYYHKRAHKGIRAYGCDVCGKKFLISEGLKTHMRTHTGERPFPCNICGSRFSAKNSLKDHIKTHVDSIFECAQCTRTFKLEKSLKQHIRLKHKTNISSTLS